MKHLFCCYFLFLILSGCSSSAQSTPEVQAVKTKDGTGIITGIVVDEAGKPIEELSIYVATIDSENLISFSINNAPRGIVDITGTFVIPDIQPGTYALAYWTPGPSGLIGDPKGTNQPVKVTVVANQTVSAGKLTIKRP